MTSRIASVRRRQLVIAGIVAGATPASLLAAQRMAGVESPAVVGRSVASRDRVVLSGRVVDAAGTPIAGAQVAARYDDATARTDADGRFVIVTNPRVSGTSPAIDVHVSHKSVSAHDHVFVRRDAAGSWRGTLEVALT